MNINAPLSFTGAKILMYSDQSNWAMAVSLTYALILIIFHGNWKMGRSFL